MKQDGALQFGRLERALFDAAHEDSRAAITEQLNAELAAPPGQALGWRDVGQLWIYLQGGHVASRQPSVAICPPKTGCHHIGLRHTLASQGWWLRGKPFGR